MNNLKPTAREVRVILNSIGLKDPKYIFNDKRVNGGRIKLWGYEMSLEDQSRLRVMLQTLFPNLLESIQVESWGNRGPNGRLEKDTVIKWSNQ